VGLAGRVIFLDEGLDRRLRSGPFLHSQPTWVRGDVRQLEVLVGDPSGG